MHQVYARRRRWLKICSATTLLGAVTVAGLELWIGLAQIEALAAIRGLALIVATTVLTGCSAVITAIVWLTDSPAVAVAMKILGARQPEPALRLVERNLPTGS